MSARRKILCIVGARPNFMKIAPIIVALKNSKTLAARLIHTGQHYDAAMKASFFEQLDIPEPDVDLEVGSASHAVQTAEIMRRFEPVLDVEAPDAILVVGDVNSTIACALVAVKMNVPVIHVEAGLRSFDRSMPEEINRVLTDQISEVLFTTESSAHDNLRREGVDDSRIHFVGNVMIDTLRAHLAKAVPPEQTLEDYPAHRKGYGVVTLHRPSNVDNPEVLGRLLSTLAELSERLFLVFPIHPRTLARIEAAELGGMLRKPTLVTMPPLGYLENLGLMAKARVVVTDSGGIQEETTALGVPCITLRDNTERPITVEQGTNVVVGSDPVRIRAAFDDIMKTGGKRGRVPELWDGKAAVRIVQQLERWLNVIPA